MPKLSKKPEVEPPRQPRLTIPQQHDAGACVHTRGDYGRHVLGYPIALPGPVDAKGKRQYYVVATDAKVLSALPVEAKGLTVPLLLPVKSVKSGEGSAEVVMDGSYVRCTVSGKGPGKKKVSLLEIPKQEGKFPPLASIFPAEKERPLAVTINVRLLKKLADAIATEGVVTLLLDPKNENASIGVVGRVGQWEPCGIGVLMPLQDTLSCREYYEEHKKNVAAAADKTINFAEIAEQQSS